MSRQIPTRAGFTLIEVLAVVLVTGILLGATINFYVDLSRQAARASENMRAVRRASALLDRVAVDLEHALLVKPAEGSDTITSPWLFLAQSRFSATGEQAGSDQLKFIRRELPRASEGPGSDLAMVAWTLERNEDGESFVLRRWSTPELPESLDSEFPRSDDPASFVVADDLSQFTLRFLDAAGQWHERWDSTQVAESGDLPLAVEISVALAPPAESPDTDAEEVEPVPYRRLVELPVRPLDLQAMLAKEEAEEVAATDPDGEEAAGAGSGRTLGECIDSSLLSGVEIPGLSPSDLNALLAAVQNSPAADFAPYAAALQGHPAVDPSCF